MERKVKNIIPVVLLLWSLAATSFVVICGREFLPQMMEDVSDEIYYHELSREIARRTEERMEKIPSELKLKSGIAAWLSIDGTVIDYPVMQEKYGLEGYYLNHRPDGKKSSSGSLYIPSYDSCSSDHVIIYGHHMHNGSMFACLQRYKDPYWSKKHSCISLTTCEGVKRYKVFAVIIQSLRTRDFKWEEFVDFDDVAGKDRFTDMCREKALFNMWDDGVFNTEDTSYITLVTCDYSVPDGRILVVGRNV